MNYKLLGKCILIVLGDWLVGALIVSLAITLIFGFIYFLVDHTVILISIIIILVFVYKVAEKYDDRH